MGNEEAKDAAKKNKELRQAKRAQGRGGRGKLKRGFKHMGKKKKG